MNREWAIAHDSGVADAADAPNGLRPDGDVPGPTSLADHAQQSPVEVDVLECEAEHFAAASAGIDQHLEDGGVAATG